MIEDDITLCVDDVRSKLERVETLRRERQGLGSTRVDHVRQAKFSRFLLSEVSRHCGVTDLQETLNILQFKA